MAKKNIIKKRVDADGVISIVAAFVVLFSALLDPVISVIIASVFLVLFGAYKLMKKR